MGGEVGGRVLQGGDGVLRQPRLREDGVVGGEHGGEECRQDEEEVEKSAGGYLTCRGTSRGKCLR